jgi:hypothetical protein
VFDLDKILYNKLSHTAAKHLCVHTVNQRSESLIFLMSVQEITFTLVSENGMTSQSTECLGKTRVLTSPNAPFSTMFRLRLFDFTVSNSCFMRRGKCHSRELPPVTTRNGSTLQSRHIRSAAENYTFCYIFNRLGVRQATGGPITKPQQARVKLAASSIDYSYCNTLYRLQNRTLKMTQHQQAKKG